MVKLYALLLFMFAIIMQTAAQTDHLVLKFKNNEQESIQLKQIKSIIFQDITEAEAIEEQSNITIIGNTPNPFSEETAIEFELSIGGNVIILIHDNTGRQIRKIECNDCSSGKNRLIWDGKDDNQNTMQSGVYYFVIRTNNKTYTKQMIKIK